MSNQLNWAEIESTFAVVDRVLLYGPPGTGKSTTPLKWAEHRGYETHSLTLTEDMSASRLEGHYLMGEEGRFVWHDGLISKAWRGSTAKPQVVVLNEVDKASGDVATFLHNALDDKEIARIDLTTGETLVPGQVLVVASMNGDPSFLGSALLDRFDVVAEVTRPHPAAIATLPQDLRKAAGSTGLPPEISFRAWKRFAKLRELLGDDVAANMVFATHAPAILDSLRIERL